MNLKNSRVFITGGAGFIGSHIADLLIKEDVSEIIVLDNLLRVRVVNLQDSMESRKITFVEGDIRDKSLIEKLTKGIDYIFHQAAVRITRCAEYPRECHEVMSEGTLNVIEACVKEKVKKLIAASSASVYGLADNFPTNEIHHPYNNRTLYGALKASNELTMRAFHEMYGLNYVALRYFNVYGPRMDIYGAYTEVLIRWMDCIDEGKSPLIFGDGKQTMDFVYVEDVARANILAVKGDATDDVFNIASGKETSLLELLETLLKVMGSTLKPEFREERKVNPVHRRLASVEKVKKFLDFNAKFNLEEGLKALVAWRISEKARAK